MPALRVVLRDLDLRDFRATSRNLEAAQALIHLMFQTAGALDVGSKRPKDHRGG